MHDEFITEEPNFDNLSYELIEPKFKHFFEKKLMENSIYTCKKF
jgi:hypothetical protein